MYFQFSPGDDIHLMLSAASSPCTPGRLQYVRVCPRFPLPGFFPPGRLSWDGGGEVGGNRSRRFAGASLNNESCCDQQNGPLPSTPEWLQTAAKVNSPDKVATSAKGGSIARRRERELSN